MKRKYHDDDDYEYVNGVKILRDGRRLSIKMNAMDSADPVQRSVARHAHVTDMQGRDGLHLNRPGFRVTADANRAARQAAYDSYDDALTSAYKTLSQKHGGYHE